MKKALTLASLVGAATTAVLAVCVPAASAAPVIPATLSCGSASWVLADSSAGVRCNGPVTTQYRAHVTCTGHSGTYYGTWYHEVPNGNTPPLSTAYCPSGSFVTSHGVSLQ